MLRRFKTSANHNFPQDKTNNYKTIRLKFTNGHISNELMRNYNFKCKEGVVAGNK